MKRIFATIILILLLAAIAETWYVTPMPKAIDKSGMTDIYREVPNETHRTHTVIRK